MAAIGPREYPHHLDLLPPPLGRASGPGGRAGAGKIPDNVAFPAGDAAHAGVGAAFRPERAVPAIADGGPAVPRSHALLHPGRAGDLAPVMAKILSRRTEVAVARIVPGEDGPPPDANGPRGPVPSGECGKSPAGQRQTGKKGRFCRFGTSLARLSPAPWAVPAASPPGRMPKRASLRPVILRAGTPRPAAQAAPPPRP